MPVMHTPYFCIFTSAVFITIAGKTEISGMVA